MKKHKRAKTKSKASTPMHDPQPDSAGVDIGAKEIWAAVPAERTEKSIRRFDAFTQNLKALVKWSLDCGVRSVAMESTGVTESLGDKSSAHNPKPLS
jgi:transposase